MIDPKSGYNGRVSDQVHTEALREERARPSGLARMRFFWPLFPLFPLFLSLTCGHPQETLPPVPETLVSSKHVDYSTWADHTVLCMDDKLADWDRFIEQTAEFLQVPAPTGRIQYVWGPKIAGADALWGCADEESACYHYVKEEDRGIIYTRELESLHEFVHAVDVPAQLRRHVILSEGVAEYLGSSKTTEEILEDFPSRFKAIATSWSYEESSYRTAMHFVGSIIERYGMERYGVLRRGVPPGANFAEFAAVFGSVYGRDLEAALTEMSSVPVQGRRSVLPGCEAGPPPLPWTSFGEMEAEIGATCGDGWFFGGGFVENAPAFFKDFVIDIEREGGYEFTVSDPHGAAQEVPRATLEPCPGVEGSTGVSSLGQESFGILAPGRHVLRVFYPPMSEAKRDLRLSLIWVGSPPP